MFTRAVNPFKPGAGRVPPELAGRDEIVSEVSRLMAQVLDSSEGDRPMIISGLRGVGKTVLLNEFVRRAQESNRWLSIKLEATAGRSLGQMIAQELHTELRKSASAGEHIREVFCEGPSSVSIIPAQGRSHRNLQLRVRCRS